MIAIQLLTTVWNHDHLMPKSLVVLHCLLLVLMMVIIIMDNPLKYHIRLLNSHLIWLLLLQFIPIPMRQFPWSVASLTLRLPVRIINRDTFNLFINRYSSAPSKLLLHKHHPAIIISMVKVPTKHHKSVVLGHPLIIRIRVTRCLLFLFFSSITHLVYVRAKISLLFLLRS